MMAYFVFIFSLMPVFFEFRRIKQIFIAQKENEKEQKQFVIQNPIFSLIALFICANMLVNNYLFLDWIDKYRIQAYPDSTLYCHVALTYEGTEAVYPCKVCKEKDEDGTYYRLDMIYFPFGEADLSNHSIHLLVDRYQKESIQSSVDESYNVSMKLINIKYKSTEKISTTDEMFEYVDLIIAIFNFIYFVDSLFILTKEARKEERFNSYFRSRFGHLQNPKTGESIIDTKSYIDALNAQEELTKEMDSM